MCTRWCGTTYKNERDGDSSMDLGLSLSEGTNTVGVWAYYCYE